MISPARRAAYASLRLVNASGVDLGSAIDQQRPRLPDDRDRALAAEITYGTLRWRAEIDHVIAWAGNRAVDVFDPEVLDLLRLSAYQLLHLNRIPHSAAVDAAVDLCKAEGKTSAAGAVNAILRRISRSRRHLPMPGPDDQLAYLSIALSHPRWLCERWLARMGFDTARTWAEFNNRPAPMTLRANRLKMTREHLAEMLADAGVATTPALFAADGLTVTSGNPLRTSLAGSGLFAVQDESSQLVAAFAGVRPGERVLDACAAPGGKTTQMAAEAGSGNGIVACDLRPRRVRLLAQTLLASGAEQVAVVCADLLAGAPFGPVFDCVAVDAPCSGLGTLRRDPDIKWKRTEADLAGFAARQVTMLSHAAQTVATGGRLVYSTCSSEPEENDRVVLTFLDAHPGFVRDDAAPSALSEPARACLDEAGDLRPTPHAHGLEPFYAARLRRVS